METENDDNESTESESSAEEETADMHSCCRNETVSFFQTVAFLSMGVGVNGCHPKKKPMLWSLASLQNNGFGKLEATTNGSSNPFDGPSDVYLRFYDNFFAPFLGPRTLVSLL